MTNSRLRVAAIQMVSRATIEANLRDAAELIGAAAREGARLVALPEYFCLMGLQDSDKVAVREPDGRGPLQDFLAAQAAEHRIWLVGGTIPLVSPAHDRVLNTLLVYDPGGQRVARYDKIHLFSFQRDGEVYDEARTIWPGHTPATLTLQHGPLTLKLGLSVCYDLRFPELYRALDGPDLILVPSAFTATTGRAHWETLLRARAVENLCYVLAPAQGGRHENGRRTHGHSMLIDPWGAILAERDEGPGVVMGEVDPSRIAECRQSLPALRHRVLV
ncbi:MAG TPA: carbon-nitrogen hydrolase family protein [Burkholderiaceae bacterium]|nr:carbon-nitrogen hydrolase family protein [Burkholderiaceae bacterium]